MAETKLVLDRNEPSKDGDNSSRYVSGTVFDGVQKAPIDGIFTSPQQLQSVSAAKLTNIAGTTELAKLPTQVELSFPLVPPAPPPDPTPLQLFLESYQQLQSAQRKVTAGLIQADDPDLASLLAATQKLYLPAYLGIG